MDQNYISLSEAAKLTNYSQDYISLLCRQEKLKGVKIGRNWVTTKQWLKEYTEKTKEKKTVNIKTKTSKKIKVQKSKSINKKKAYLSINYDSLDAYELQNRFSLFVKFMSVLFLVFAFGVNFIFFQSWSSSLDKRLAGLKINNNNNNNNIEIPVQEKSFLTESKYQGRVAGAKDENEIYQIDDQIQIEAKNLTSVETETEEDKNSLYIEQ